MKKRKIIILIVLSMILVAEGVLYFTSSKSYADISEKFLYEIEMGKKGFSATTLMNICDALEVSLDYIMTGSGVRKYEDEIVATLEKFKPHTLEMINHLLKIAYDLSKGA